MSFSIVAIVIIDRVILQRVGIIKNDAESDTHFMYISCIEYLMDSHHRCIMSRMDS